MHLVVACTAHPCPALFAFPYLPTILEADMIRFDPFAAMTGRAVDAIASGIFVKFPVPSLLELLIKELVNMLEGNVLRSAALWWHMGRIGNGHCKDPA